MGWVIGTLILWALKLITVPFAKALAGRNMPTTLPPPADPNAGTLQAGFPQQPVTAKPKSEVDLIPTGYYILADVIVLGIAGVIIGLVTGSYFIGISWRAKDWPGMIAFIVASFIGSALHG